MTPPFLDFETLLLSHGVQHPRVGETFVRIAYRPARQFAALVLDDPVLAETLTPTLLETALKSLSHYPTGTDFATWLYALVMDECRTIQRRKWWKTGFRKTPAPAPLSAGKPPALATTLPDTLRLPLMLAYGFDLEIPQIAEILHHRETTIQTRIESALRQLPGLDREEKTHALKGEIARCYPTPPEPAEGFPALIERITSGTGQGNARTPLPIPFTFSGEFAWVSLAVLFLAGIFWVFNQTDTENTTLPLFPSPTPPLPEVITPGALSIFEQPESRYATYYDASDPASSADGRLTVYSVNDENGSSIYLYNREEGKSTPINLLPDSLNSENNFLFYPDISADGTKIVFMAEFFAGSKFACPYGTGFSCSQIILYDRAQQSLRIISSDLVGNPGNAESSGAVISGDGRYVAFWSFADNLVPGDNEHCQGNSSQVDDHNCGDIFVKDLQTSAIQRIPVGRNHNYWTGFQLDLSVNGEWLVFTLSNLNVVEKDLNLTPNPEDVFAVHLPTGEFHPVNLASDGTPGNGSSHLGKISGDGRYVAFVSEASNLSDEKGEQDNDVFLHDLINGETLQISLLPNGEPMKGSSGMIPGNDWSSWLSMSANGRWTIFNTFIADLTTSDFAAQCAPNFGNPRLCYGIFLYDRQTGKTTQVNLPGSNPFILSEAMIYSPSISDDGQWLSFSAIELYKSPTCPVGNCSEVYSFDLQTETRFSISKPVAEVVALATTWQFQTYLEGHDAWVNGVAISPNGEFLASAGQEGSLLLWNLAEERIQQTLSAGTTPINAVAFSSNGFLAAGDQEGTVCVYAIPTGETYRCLSDHPGGVRSLAFSPDGEFLVVGARGVVRVWRFVEGDLLHVREYPYPGGFVESVAFSPDGDLLATAVSSEIWVRETSTGEIVARLKGHYSKIFDVAFSPDGQFLASGSEDQTAVIWKIEKIETDWRFEYHATFQHEEWVRAVAFSPDSQFLATGTFDSIIVQWRITDGQPVQTLQRTTQDQVIDLAFSPDGKQIAAGTVRGLRLWAYGPTTPATFTNTSFFAFKNDETLITDDPYLAPVPNETQAQKESVLSLDEARQRVSLFVREPEVSISGFTLSSIYVFKDPGTGFEAVSITYLQTTSFQPSFLTITQSNVNPLQFDYPIGKLAHVAPTYVFGESAELVLGGWNIANTLTDADGIASFERFWDEELASQWLRWQRDDVFFSLLYDQPYNQQSIASSEQFTLEQLLTIAESFR